MRKENKKRKDKKRKKGKDKEKGREIDKGKGREEEIEIGQKAIEMLKIREEKDKYLLQNLHLLPHHLQTLIQNLLHLSLKK